MTRLVPLVMLLLSGCATVLTGQSDPPRAGVERSFDRWVKSPSAG